jgi:malonate decarboxylase beta subunit
MGIAARCANTIVMSEEGRLAMSGPEVIETAHGVEEFDSRDRALVWRTTGGKHRYLLGDCQSLVPDNIDAFRRAALQAIEASRADHIGLTLSDLEAEQAMLERRVQDFGTCPDPWQIWQQLGIASPASVPMLEAEAFVKLADAHRAGGK